MNWLIWLAIIVIGLGVAIGLYAMCCIGAQSDELMAKIRRAEVARKGGK